MWIHKQRSKIYLLAHQEMANNQKTMFLVNAGICPSNCVKVPPAFLVQRLGLRLISMLQEILNRTLPNEYIVKIGPTKIKNDQKGGPEISL